jgi:MFS family permease
VTARRASVGAIEVLRIPDFRRYWLGFGLTGFGLNFWFLGVAWVVLELTNSPFAVGSIGALAAMPSIALSLLGGVLTDRIDRRRMLVISRLVWALQCLVTGLLVSTGAIEAWHVLALAVVFGVADAASRPAGYTLVVDIVGRSRLVAANALDQVAEFGGELVAPLVAGMVIASTGSAPVFYLATALLLVAALSLALIRVAPSGEPAGVTEGRAGVLADARAGLAYVLRTPPFPALLGVSALSLLAGAIFPLIPLYARDVLAVGPRGFGAMSAALAAGMLAGALVMAALGEVRRPGLVMLLARAAWFGAMAAFAISEVFALSLGLLVLMGAAGAVAGNFILTEFQRYAEDRMRGRVMSIHRIAESLEPLGAVVGGALASMLGAEQALLLCATFGALALGGIAVGSPSLRRG